MIESKLLIFLAAQNVSFLLMKQNWKFLRKNAFLTIDFTECHEIRKASLNGLKRNKVVFNLATTFSMVERTFLNDSLEQFVFPKPRIITGCCTFATIKVSIFFISIGNKYQLHCKNVSSIIWNLLVNRSLNSHAMQITIKVPITKKIIRMNSILFKCWLDWECERKKNQKWRNFWIQFIKQNRYTTSPNSKVNKPEQTDVQVHRNKTVILNSMTSLYTLINLKLRINEWLYKYLFK